MSVYFIMIDIEDEGALADAAAALEALDDDAEAAEALEPIVPKKPKTTLEINKEAKIA